MVLNDELVLEFREDSTINVLVNDVVIQSSNWTVQEGDDDLFEIEATPLVGEVLGRLLICDNDAVFSFSHFDGCDKYFSKLE
jgi:hypothetical protein